MDAGSLIAELKRRRVFRVLIGYGVVSFAVLQVIEPIVHGLALPDSMLKIVVVLLGLGFPLAVVLAWAFDVNEGRVQRAPPAGPGGWRGARLASLLVGIGLLAAAPGIGWYFLWRKADRPAAAERTPSIAVLPFVNLSGEKENEYFSDGMTEELINALANIEGLRVVARTSAFSYKGRNVDARKIGEELQVSTIVEGSVRRDGKQLRVTAQLIQAADGYHRWSKTYDRELKNIFSVEDELARAIVQELKARIVPGATLVGQTTSNLEAHDLYLRGRYFWNQRTRESLAKAQALFERAIAADPGYALAWSGLADSLLLSIEYGDGHAAEVMPRAMSSARKAVELDEGLAEAHASLALASSKNYDWATSEREFRRAVELRPGYAIAHHWFALNLAARGRLLEAKVEAERARQLDPTSAIVNAALANLFLLSGEPALALETALRAVELDPALFPARAVLVRSYLALGKISKAQAAAAVGTGEQVQSALPELRAYLLAREGDFAGARRILADLEAPVGTRRIRAATIAQVHLMLGDLDACFAILERGVEERDQAVRGLKVSPEWDPIRSDPRYHALLRRMNLE